jgi:hypothetical protein
MKSVLLSSSRSALLLPDLAPARMNGCRGFVGPVPPPLSMSGKAVLLPSQTILEKFYHILIEQGRATFLIEMAIINLSSIEG